MEVKIHVYDLPNAQSTNSSLRSLGIGLYHTGLELRGFEYSFSSAGVSRTTPKLPDFGIWRETILVGNFSGTMNDFQIILNDLRSGDFGVGSYDLIYLNCNHFTDALSMRLTSCPLPEWVNRAASMAASISPRPTLTGPRDTGGFAALGKVSEQSPIYGLGKLVGPSPPPAPAADAPAGNASVFSWIGSLFGSTNTGAPATTALPGTRSTGGGGSGSGSAPAVKVTLDKVDPSQKRELTQQQRDMLAKLKAKK